MRSYKAQGVVLHTVKYGESSVIAYIFTDKIGRATYMIQGVHSKRGRGNKSALLQPMFLLEIEGRELPNAQMHRVKEMQSLVPLSSLPFDPRKSAISLFMAEVLYKLIKEIEPNPELFEFVRDSVIALDKMDSNSGVANFHLWFLVKLSYFLGFYPANEYGDGDYFDIHSGHFVRHIPRGGFCMCQESSQTLGRLIDIEIGELSELKLSRAQRSLFIENILKFFGYHLDQINSIHSIKILSEIFK